MEVVGCTAGVGWTSVSDGDVPSCLLEWHLCRDDVCVELLLVVEEVEECRSWCMGLWLAIPASCCDLYAH